MRREAGLCAPDLIYVAFSDHHHRLPSLAGDDSAFFSFFFSLWLLGPARNLDMLQKLLCSPRLVATGGFCADHSSQPLYAHLIDPKFSRTELINHGDLKTFDELRRESEDKEAAEHHHFS